MKILIAEYSPAWREQFKREKRLLEIALGKNTGVIEHIGSTSVEGLAAKPIIDILIGLHDFSIAGSLISKIENLGYQYVPQFEDVMPDRRYFRKMAEGTRTHHIHMVEIGGEFWERHLLFRDFLRTNPNVAAEYGALKKRLAEIDWSDINEYTDAKTAFIKDVENRAGKQIK